MVDHDSVGGGSDDRDDVVSFAESNPLPPREESRPAVRSTMGGVAGTSKAGSLSGSLARAETSLPPHEPTPHLRPGETAILKGTSTTIQLEEKVGGRGFKGLERPTTRVALGGFPIKITQIQDREFDRLIEDPEKIDEGIMGKMDARSFSIQLGPYQLLVGFDNLQQKVPRFFNAANRETVKDQLKDTDSLLELEDIEQLKELEKLLDKLVDKGTKASEKARTSNDQEDKDRQVSLDVGQALINEKPYLSFRPTIEGVNHDNGKPSSKIYLVYQDPTGKGPGVVQPVGPEGVSIPIESDPSILGPDLGKHGALTFGADCTIKITDGNGQGASSMSKTRVARLLPKLDDPQERYIRRSDGAVEPGWKVLEELDGETLTMWKPNDPGDPSGGYMTKPVKKTALRELNSLAVA